MKRHSGSGLPILVGILNYFLCLFSPKEIVNNVMEQVYQGSKKNRKTN